MATGRPATLLVVNTLTSKKHETPHAVLERNGLDTGLLTDMPLSLLPDFGVATRETCIRPATKEKQVPDNPTKSIKFAGVTFALLQLDVPEGLALPFASGQEFAPSKARRCGVGYLNQRLIRACAGGVEFAEPLPPSHEEGLPHTLTAFMGCLSSSSHDQRGGGHVSS
jgi:hypothetical protein